MKPQNVFWKVQAMRDESLLYVRFEARTMLPAPGAKAADRNTVAYSLFVKNGAGEDIYEATIGDDASSRLIAVQGKRIDVKLPLAGLGAEGGSAIALEEADAVIQILPYTVEAYRSEGKD